MEPPHPKRPYPRTGRGHDARNRFRQEAMTRRDRVGSAALDFGKRNPTGPLRLAHCGERLYHVAREEGPFKALPGHRLRQPRGRSQTHGPSTCVGGLPNDETKEPTSLAALAWESGRTCDPAFSLRARRRAEPLGSIQQHPGGHDRRPDRRRDPGSRGQHRGHRHRHGPDRGDLERRAVPGYRAGRQHVQGDRLVGRLPDLRPGTRHAGGRANDDAQHPARTRADHRNGQRDLGGPSDRDRRSEGLGPDRRAGGRRPSAGGPQLHDPGRPDARGSRTAFRRRAGLRAGHRRHFLRRIRRQSERQRPAGRVQQLQRGWRVGQRQSARRRGQPQPERRFGAGTPRIAEQLLRRIRPELLGAGQHRDQVGHQRNPRHRRLVPHEQQASGAQPLPAEGSRLPAQRGQLEPGRPDPQEPDLRVRLHGHSPLGHRRGLPAQRGQPGVR